MTIGPATCSPLEHEASLLGTKQRSFPTNVQGMQIWIENTNSVYLVLTAGQLRMLHSWHVGHTHKRASVKCPIYLSFLLLNLLITHVFKCRLVI